MSLRYRRVCLRALIAVGCLTGRGLGQTASAASAGTTPIGHVFVIVLENESAATTFGPSSPSPYLAHTLTAQGAYLPNYFATGHESNDNYISMVSGDASSCCGEMPRLGSPSPGVTGPGGGDIGAVLLSPCIAPGTVSETAYNHYSMLGSVENLFGLAHLAVRGSPRVSRTAC